MKGAWKQSGAAAVIDHLGVVGGGGIAVCAGRARPARLCLYSLALAFAAFMAFLAFSPAPSSPAASWFDGLIASASPYRAQVSGFISSLTLFPANSSHTGPPGGGAAVAARRAGPSGGEFAERGSPEENFGPSAPLPGERLGSGGGVRTSGAGGILNGGGAPSSAPTAAVQGAAPPNDHVGGGAEAKNVTGSAVAEAEGAVEIPSRGSAQNGATVKGGVPVQSNGADVNGSSADAGDGSAVKASARNAAGSTHQIGSAIAVLSNGTAVPLKNRTGRAVEATMGGNGTPSQRSEATGNNQTLLPHAPADTQNRAASGGSNMPVDLQKGSNSSQQGSASLVRGDHSAPAVTTVANNSNAVPVKEPATVSRRRKVDWIESMASCDMFYGNWVRDNSYPLYPAGSCPHIDESFNCHRNGRPDNAFQRLRWQPSGCKIPRLNPIDMLERLRGKRLVFVGDSLNRNMWESLVCILRNSVRNKTKVFEVSGRSQFKAQGAYSFLFQDYNCSVEFFRSPFLVQEWEMPVRHGKGTRETLRLDIIDRTFPRYRNADIVIFNTGHWWTHEKTSLGKNYYQEGNHVYRELNVHDAYRRALNTWAKWVDSNIDPKKTTVFFRGYSASHFSGGQWNSGGNCDQESEPITNERYLTPYPTKMTILEEVLHGMKTPVVYLNITRMTDYRKEAHPSVYRKYKMSEEERKSPDVYQDCSHWCLPGVPDSWNELLYAQILVKQSQTMQQ